MILDFEQNEESIGFTIIMFILLSLFYFSENNFSCRKSHVEIWE